MFQWFNAREASKAGAALADQLASQIAARSAARGRNSTPTDRAKDVQELIRRTDNAVPELRFNIYKRAKFAHSFKWRLLENGVASEFAEELTQSLVLHISLRQSSVPPSLSRRDAKEQLGSGDAEQLFALGSKYLSQGNYAEAVALYQKLIDLYPHHARALNNLGVALSSLGRYREAEIHFRQAIHLRPDDPEAHSNLGNVLRWRGQMAEAEISLRRAVKSKPKHVDALNNLGWTLLQLGRLRDARGRFEKILKIAPRHAEALLGLGHVARMEGRFDDAEVKFNQALAIKPKMPSAWAALVGTQKMTSSQSPWLKTAEEIASSGIGPTDEADMRFAIGKYYDDVSNFERAFRSYERGNELLRAIADPYDRKARTDFVDDLIRVHTQDGIAGAKAGASESVKPIFVVGMMRSGTSLVEQIIASHPAAKGAGELGFWSGAARSNETAVRQARLDERLRKKLAEAYLRTLASYSTDAPRVIDKAPVNSDYLGVIHSIFPNARIIYMQRNPMDSCLSCYFQQFSASLNYTMNLSDLAHYYRQHDRLITHWRDVLPPGTILDVPYEELVSDQEGWTRKILDFLGLEWDERCLQFHQTKRPVATASYWQVRQMIYRDSVERWRDYERFIGPLLSLRDLK